MVQLWEHIGKCLQTLMDIHQVVDTIFQSEPIW